MEINKVMYVSDIKQTFCIGSSLHILSTSNKMQRDYLDSFVVLKIWFLESKCMFAGICMCMFYVTPANFLQANQALNDLCPQV